MVPRWKKGSSECSIQAEKNPAIGGCPEEAAAPRSSSVCDDCQGASPLQEADEEESLGGIVALAESRLGYDCSWLGHAYWNCASGAPLVPSAEFVSKPSARHFSEMVPAPS